VRFTSVAALFFCPARGQEYMLPHKICISLFTNTDLYGKIKSPREWNSLYLRVHFTKVKMHSPFRILE